MCGMIVGGGGGVSDFFVSGFELLGPKVGVASSSAESSGVFVFGVYGSISSKFRLPKQAKAGVCTPVAPACPYNPYNP